MTFTARLLISALLIVPIGMGGCNATAPVAEIYDAALARAVDDKGKAIAQTTTFSTADTMIVAVFRMRNASSVESIRVVISDGNRRALMQLDTLVDTRAEAYGYRLRTMGRQIPPGEYLCEIYLDPASPEPVRQPDQVLKFRLVSTGDAGISRATLARGVDETTGEPIGPTTTFARSDTGVYILLNLVNAPVGTTVGVIWKDAAGNDIEKDELKMEQVANTLYFAIGSEEGIDPGRYSCQLYLVPPGRGDSSRVDTTLAFTVTP